MDISGICRQTIIAFINHLPRGTQSKLCDALGFNRANLSSYLKGREPMSEQRRSQIADYFGFGYTEFIDFGRRLFESDEPYFWALRAIYNDQKQFEDLASDTGIEINDLESVLKGSLGHRFPADYIEKICTALMINPEAFMASGQREMLRNPLRKWNIDKTHAKSIGLKWKNHEAVENKTEVDEITHEHFEIVKKFKYKERLKKINEDLLIIEQNSDALRDVEIYIRGLAAGIRYSSIQNDRPEGNFRNGTSGEE